MESADDKNKEVDEMDVLQMEDTKRQVLLEDVQSKNFADPDF